MKIGTILPRCKRVQELRVQELGKKEIQEVGFREWRVMWQWTWARLKQPRAQLFPISPNRHVAYFQTTCLLNIHTDLFSRSRVGWEFWSVCILSQNDQTHTFWKILCWLAAFMWWYGMLTIQTFQLLREQSCQNVHILTLNYMCHFNAHSCGIIIVLLKQSELPIF